jgi:hypothetical protein
LVSDTLMRQRQLIVPDAITNHQQPTA